MSLRDHAEELAVHDAQNWVHSRGFETDRHNLIHVLKTAGKYAAHVEEIDDGRAPEDTPLDPAIAADLIIYGLRALTNQSIDPDDALATRLQEIRERAQSISES